MVRGTFSPARAWRPAVVARLARTLGITNEPRALVGQEQPSHGLSPILSFPDEHRIPASITDIMQPALAYDPEIQPDTEPWLEIDEQERISLAETFHRRAGIDLPNVMAHAVFHAIVENQIALKVGAVVRAIPRLMRQGLSRHDAIHAIASVLAEYLHEQANIASEDSSEVANARYEAAVERLSAKEWLANYGTDGDGDA